MEITEDIQIPEVVPVMTLQETVLFPHAVMPLFIFENRYREMLKDVLRGNRLFAVFNECRQEDEEGHEAPLCKMGTVGVIRAAHQNPDGTSNLALQGIARVKLQEVVQEAPYRLIHVAKCRDAQVDEPAIPSLQGEIIELIQGNPHLTRGLPREYVQFIHSLSGPGPFIDVAAHSICHDSQFKQRLLETLSLPARFDLMRGFLAGECRRHELFKILQGTTRDDKIELN
jgi:ATP-dependent Lon protease